MAPWHRNRTPPILLGSRFSVKYSIRENTDGGRTVFVTAGEYSQTIAWVLALVLLFDLSFSVGSQFAKEGFMRDKTQVDKSIAELRDHKSELHRKSTDAHLSRRMVDLTLSHATKELADRKARVSK